MKTFIAVRDNLFLFEFARKHKDIEIVNIKIDDVLCLVPELLKAEIELVIQIAPQWAWGKYVEDISRDIMDNNIKLIAGEGAMFRNYGENFECGADIGFYLSPWGYSGNSKMAYSLPKPTGKDLDIATRIMKNQKKWRSNNTNGKVLVAGQLDNDRSKFYSKHIYSNLELLDTVLKTFDEDHIVFRPHPQDEFNYKEIGVEIEKSGCPFADIVHKYEGVISINSTSTIEAMCSGVPVFNFEIAPWSSCSVIKKGTSPILEKFDYDQYRYDIASLVHLHYLNNFSFGTPIINSLNWYSDYNPDAFSFDCEFRKDQPKIWNEQIRNNKY